jgi:hypothetical protein
LEAVKIPTGRAMQDPDKLPLSQDINIINEKTEESS